ncbi:MAG: type 4a pilus biogenesis protein PilO [Fibrobacteres bacterium]|nr:type 4a pilus biogenesis protein PilO [Fibrobacterota bacterium]
MNGLRAWRARLAFTGMFAGIILGVAILSVGGGLAVAEIFAQTGRYRAYKALQAGAGQADSLSAAYVGIQKDLHQLRSALPNGNPGAQVLNRLVESAKACSLSIAGITALDEVPFPGYRELPYEMEVAGGFKELVRYLRDLETGGVAIQVRGLSIHTEAINKARIKAKLGISAFALGSAGASSTGSTGVTQAAAPSAPDSSLRESR